jgi:hypothetical protein
MLIGSLLYIILSTKVNIAFAIIKLTRYMSNLSNIYFIAVKRVFKYLKETKDYRITYYKNTSRFISNYYNTDYISDLSAKSTTGYIILLARGIINWKSKL